AVPAHGITAPVTRFALGVILAATLSLSGWQAYSIANADTERADFQAVIERVPSGHTLFATHSGIGSSQIEYDRIGLYHFGADAVRTRRIIVQSLFANPAQQPIRYREERFDNPRDNGRVFINDLVANLEEQGISAADHIAKFDWAVVRGPSPETDRIEVPLDGFARVDSRGNFRLYCQIDRVADPTVGPEQAVCRDGLAP
ncbi:MAG: hypothetical protein KKH72_02550, partial [Alphaproteobacteria bacterium]|nr:hypothetical protein [Alphaproteobacteria bacterium]